MPFPDRADLTLAGDLDRDETAFTFVADFALLFFDFVEVDFAFEAAPDVCLLFVVEVLEETRLDEPELFATDEIPVFNLVAFFAFAVVVFVELLDLIDFAVFDPDDFLVVAIVVSFRAIFTLGKSLCTSRDPFCIYPYFTESCRKLSNEQHIVRRYRAIPCEAGYGANMKYG